MTALDKAIAKYRLGITCERLERDGLTRREAYARAKDFLTPEERAYIEAARAAEEAPMTTLTTERPARVADQLEIHSPAWNAARQRAYDARLVRIAQEILYRSPGRSLDVHREITQEIDQLPVNLGGYGSDA